MTHPVCIYCGIPIATNARGCVDLECEACRANVARFIAPDQREISVGDRMTPAVVTVRYEVVTEPYEYFDEENTMRADRL